MALELGSVAQSSNSVTIGVAANGSPADAFDLSGVKLEAGLTYRFPSPDGAAQTLNISTWDFDATATPSNPITIQIQGFSCTLIVPAGETSRISGGGFSGTGAVVVEAVSPFWTPAQITGAEQFIFGEPNYYEASPLQYTDSLGGSSTLSVDVDGTPPTQNEVDGYAYFQGGNRLNLDFPTEPRGFWAMYQPRDGAFRQLLDSLQGDDYGIDDGGVRVRTDTGQNVYSGSFNGRMDANGVDPEIISGSSFSALSFTYPMGNQLNTWVINVFNWNPSNNIVRIKGSPGDAYVRLIGWCPQALTTEQILQLQAYITWQGINRGLIDSSYFDSTHPYISGPPLLAGGGSSSVTVITPPTQVIFSNIPETGSKLVVYNAANNSDLAIIQSSTLSSHTLTYDASGVSAVRIQIISPPGTFEERNINLDVEETILVNVGEIADPDRNYRNP